MEINLKDTVYLMNSNDYKERFIAEYYQVKIRLSKLLNMISLWDDGKLNFKPSCPKITYLNQINAMEHYIRSLDLRACVEGIEIYNIKLSKYEVDVKYYTKPILVAMENSRCIFKSDSIYYVLSNHIKEIFKVYYQPNYLHSVVELKSGQEIAIKGDGDKMCNIKKAIESLKKGEKIEINTLNLKAKEVRELREAIKNDIIIPDEKEIVYTYKDVESVLNGNVILPEMTYIKL